MRSLRTTIPLLPLMFTLFHGSATAQSGSVLWTSGIGGGMWTSSIAITGHRLVLAGAWGGGPFKLPVQWLVSAFDTRTGQVLWEDRGPPGSSATALCEHGSRVFVTGHVPSSTGSDAIVVAYDARTGESLWRTGGLVAEGPITAVGSRVFITAFVSNQVVVTGLDAASGNVLWQSDLWGPYESVAALVVRGTRVFAAGSSGSELAVRAYDAESGALLWTHLDTVIPGSGAGVAAMDALASRVFVAGWAGFPGRFLVRALHASTGTVLWTDQFSLGTPLGQNAAAALVASGGNVFAAGRGSRGPSSPSEFVVRCYLASNGVPTWTHVFASGTGLGAFATTIDVHGGCVIAGGSGDWESFMGGAGLVRSIDRDSGSLLWSDMEQVASVVSAVAVKGDRVFAAGSQWSKFGPGAIGVRAYQR